MSSRLLLLLFAMVGLAVVFAPLPVPAIAPQVRTFEIDARQFAYSPSELKVNTGDTVTIQLVSTDVVHGLYVDGYDLSVEADPGQSATLTFVADKPGSFRFRCNVTCGVMHPFMIGKITVGSNQWFYRSVGLSLLAMIGLFPLSSLKEAVFDNYHLLITQMELTRLPLLKSALKSRYPQLAVFVVMLVGYIFAILAGLIGTPVGSHNFSIVFVWIAWWAIFILVAVPFFGRGWCAVCPIPLPGEWLQRGAILTPPDKRPKWPYLRVPKMFRNIWLQNVSFLLLALFSSVLLNTPNITGIVLAAMLFAAIGLSIILERRAFCRYLCPVGGFIGLYSQTAPIELRIKDKQVCVKCKDKPCYNGSSTGYGCPWDVFPGGLTKNTYCGLCMECIRTCPYDNIAINLRPFSADLTKPSTRMDEAFKAFIMLGSAMIYAGVLLGPWGTLKDAAYLVGSRAWFAYATVFLAILFVLLPGVFTLGLLKTSSNRPLKQRFASLSRALIPLGLMFWVAFSLSFVLTNASYILAALSDPLGFGWNLFGTANTTWQPMLTSILAPAQTLALIGGLVWSARTAQKVASEVKVSPIPVEAKVGEPIHMKITSDDVVHGFAVGQMDMESIDILPGKATDITLNFDKPGIYTFYCTRWCGLNHWRMRGTIEVSGSPSVPEPVSPPLYVSLNLNLDAPHDAPSTPSRKPSVISGQQFATDLPITNYQISDYYRSHSPYQAFNDLSTLSLNESQRWDVSPTSGNPIPRPNCLPTENNSMLKTVPHVMEKTAQVTVSLLTALLKRARPPCKRWMAQWIS